MKLLRIAVLLPFLFTIYCSFSHYCSFSQKATLVMPAGHAQKVSQIEVSYDSRFMASIDSTNTIVIWEIDGKRELLHLQEPEISVVSIAFHPSESILVSCNSNGNMVYWDVLKGTITKKIKGHSSGAILSFVSDGKTLVSAFDKELKLWDYMSGKVKSTIQTDEAITALAVGGSFDQITIGTGSGNVTSYSITNFQKMWTVNLGSEISYLAYYESKPKIIAGTSTGDVASVHVTKQELIERKRVQSAPIHKILIDEQGGQIVVAGNDPSGYIKFLKSTSFNDETTKKFVWSSTPKDDLGLYSLAWTDTTNSVMLAGNHDNVIESWNRISQTWDKLQFKGFSRPINSIDVNFTGEKLAVASNQTRLKILDLTGARQPFLLEGHRGGITSVDFHPDRHRLVTVGRDQKINVWNPVRYEPILSTKHNAKDEAYFTANKKFIRQSNQKLEAYDYGKKNGKTVADLGNNFGASADGSRVASVSSTGLSFYSASLVLTGQVTLPNLIDFSFSDNDVLGLTSENKVFTMRDNQLLKSFTLTRSVDKIFALPDGSFVVWASDSNSNYSGYFYSSNGQETSELSGHQNSITDAKNLNSNLLTSSKDGTIKIWKKDGLGYVEAATIILLRNQDYVVTTPWQLFDASATAMNKLHYVKDGQILSLAQLKDLYYEPDLLAKLMGFNPEPIRERVDLSSIKIYPNFDILHPKDNNGNVGIRLKDNGGGIGKVVLIINGKEVSNDVQGGGTTESDLDINYDIKGHPYMKYGINKITIKAYNNDGTLASEGKNIYVKLASEGAKTKSRLFAVVIGSADYASDEMDLKYAAKDASDFHDALKMSATNLLGAENVTIRLLSTDNVNNSLKPTKTNIRRAFTDFSKNAQATDYLVVYMAGHGVNYTKGDNTDFYYLTSSAKSDDIRDDGSRSKVAISSTEMTELFKSVAALKQVLIVDACHSGSIDLEARAKKTMSSDEVRALEKMKDRTGLFILAGSAADAVSYETSMYGQGLLTYSLLFGMKGAALRDNEFVDIIDLFQFAANKVPELAADIGGIQKPEIRVPADVESFDIGLLRNEHKDKIKIKSPKPIFVHSNFQDKKDFLDAIDLGGILDSRLLKLGNQPGAPIVFVDDKKFSGSIVVSGRYEEKENNIKAEVRVFKDGNRIGAFEEEGGNALLLTDKILVKLLNLVDDN